MKKNIIIIILSLIVVSFCGEFMYKQILLNPEYISEIKECIIRKHCHDDLGETIKSLFSPQISLGLGVNLYPYLAHGNGYGVKSQKDDQLFSSLIPLSEGYVGNATETHLGDAFLINLFDFPFVKTDILQPNTNFVIEFTNVNLFSMGEFLYNPHYPKTKNPLQAINISTLLPLNIGEGMNKTGDFCLTIITGSPFFSRQLDNVRECGLLVVPHLDNYPYLLWKPNIQPLDPEQPSTIKVLYREI